MKKLVDNALGMKRWETEDLPIILEILEERILNFGGDIESELGKKLIRYYECYKDQKEGLVMKGIGAESYNKIGEELKRKGIIPSDQEMYEIIQARNNSGTQVNVANTNLVVKKIIKRA